MSSDMQTILDTALELLRSIAPEIDTVDFDPAKALRQQLDLDSIDWLNFLIGLHERLGVDIAESDYIRLISLNDITAYIHAKLK
jgi:acyl carrier protein